jgi:hypothetical protein
MQKLPTLKSHDASSPLIFFGHATLVVRDGQPFFGLHQLSAVMPALVAGIHDFLAGSKTRMAGTSPAMTLERLITKEKVH